jgi:hypothetical protein
MPSTCRVISLMRARFPGVGSFGRTTVVVSAVW